MDSVPLDSPGLVSPLTPPTTGVVHPGLTQFTLKANSEYFDDPMAQIDVTRLGSLFVTCFHQPLPRCQDLGIPGLARNAQ
jgi:hypothetical protein